MNNHILNRLHKFCFYFFAFFVFLPLIAQKLRYEPLVRWNRDWTDVIPNVAAAVAVNDASSEFTFHLRPGLRWSDGEPFTADDLLFWYAAVAIDPDVSPTGAPPWFVVDAQPGVVEKVDNFTVRITFAAPNSLFLQYLATPPTWPLTQTPRHYLAQFHGRFADNADARARQAGYPDWVAHFQAKTEINDRFRNAGMPVLWAWRLMQGYGEATTQLVAERNPYYWKVDPAGNQLPYLDRIVYERLESPALLLLKALAGEIDLQDRHIATVENRAVLFDGQAAGDYRFFATTPEDMNTMVLSLNLTHPDPVKRNIYQTKAFRIGLSHAINRQQIIDTVYIGQGEPYQVAPRPDSPFYHARLARQYTVYDVALANQHLDDAGFAERNDDGLRLGPDGEPITVRVDVIQAFHPEWVDVLALIQQDWWVVGIDLQIAVIDRSLFLSRVQANQYDAVVWNGLNGRNVLLDPVYYFPYRFLSFYAIAWADWYEHRAQGEEPPAPVQQQMALFNPEQLTVLEQRTEGWAAGLQLAALSVMGRNAQGIDQFVAAFHGDHQYVFDYLMEEVLAQQTTEVRQFLLPDIDP